MRGRFTLNRLGALLVVLIAMAVVTVVGVSSLMRIAGDDMNAAVDEAHGIPAQPERSELGRWLSARLSADLAADDDVDRKARARQLVIRSDRVREAAGVGALVGLLVAVLTGSPATNPAHPRRVEQSGSS